MRRERKPSINFWNADGTPNPECPIPTPIPLPPFELPDLPLEKNPTSLAPIPPQFSHFKWVGPHLGYQDLDAEYWRRLVVASIHCFKENIEAHKSAWLAPERFFSAITGRKSLQSQALERQDYYAFIRTLPEGHIGNLIGKHELEAIAKETDAARREDYWNKKNSCERLGNLQRLKAANELRIWENHRLTNVTIPLLLLKTLGLTATTVRPTRPFVYATVFLPDAGHTSRPWLYIGKRQNPGDHAYLGSGKKLQAAVSEFGVHLFLRYTMAELPSGADWGELEYVEAGILARFQARQDQRLFNLRNS